VKVIVAGAGLGGLTAAVTLRPLGVGINLSLSP
jgi:monoamine oxidase